jgi:L-asparagine oxygenase
VGGELAVTAGSIGVDVAVYELAPDEREEIEGLLASTMKRWDSAEADELLVHSAHVAHELPEELVEFVCGFRLTEPAAALAVKGFEVDDRSIGRTPTHWDAQPDPRSTLREELYFVLIGSLLGELFGWSTLQRGRLVHNVLPIKGEEEEQSGHGSSALLEWHTEDGFHPFRCDYLGLMALRNPDGVPTTFASIEAVELTEEQRQVLAEPRFLIRPDNEHLREKPAPPGLDNGSFRRQMEAMRAKPKPAAVLFGAYDRPYLRIDPFFMSAMPGDTEAAEALGEIVGQLEQGLEDVVLESGDVFVIDNYRAVHGRRSFRARYDGTDRWLKKILVTRDLRKSRAARSSAASRVLA